MNCAECQENLVASAEGLLDLEAMLELRAHLETCADCAAEYVAVINLQQKLVSRGQAAADVAIVESVMKRVLQQKKEKENIMSRLFKHRWGFGLGVAASAAVILLIVFLAFPKMQVTAAEVMARGAQVAARITSIHLRGEVRSTPQDNFASVMPNQKFVSIQLWKQFQPDLKWRIEKPLRVVVMNGDSTVMFIKDPIDLACILPQRTTSAFDTKWLQHIANLSHTITSELTNALAKGWKMKLATKRDADGQTKDIVTIETKSGLPVSDYLNNQFFQTANTRRVYVFDDQSERLEAVKIYLHTKTGDKLIFKLDQIDYNPSITPNVWKLDLPADVSWWRNKMPVLPDNEKYAALTAEQAAQAFFKACSQKDWGEAEKFMKESPVDRGTKQELGGLKIISIGTAFASKASPAHFVPYEIKLNNGHVKKMNLALRRDKATGRWFVDGGY